MVPKSIPEGHFFDYRETLIFDDSTMVFHGFSLPEGVRKGPKIDENTVPQIIRKKIRIILFFFSVFLRFRASLLGPFSAILGTKWSDEN